MQPLTAPVTSTKPGPRAPRGRWIWALSGTITIALAGGFGGWAIVRAENPSAQPPPVTAAPTRTVTVAQPVTALRVRSYGGSVKVTTALGGPVRIAESVSYNWAGRPPTVTDTDVNGVLTLAAPACAVSACSVGFDVTVPSGVTVGVVSSGGVVTVVGAKASTIDSGGAAVYASAIGGPVTVRSYGGEVTVNSAAGADIDSGGGQVAATGVSGGLTVQSYGGGVTVSHAPTATIDSGGGPVYASSIGGPLTVTAEGGDVTVSGAGRTRIDSGGGPATVTTIRGPLDVTTEGGGVQADDVTGTLNADTGSGPLSATSLTSSLVTAMGYGGSVTLGFTTAPSAVRVDTGGGDASLAVPGGPYAVTTDAGDFGDVGGPSASVLIPVSPGATRSISVSTEGGNLQIGPA